MSGWIGRLPPAFEIDDVERSEIILIAVPTFGVGLILGGALGFFLFRRILFGVFVLGIPMGAIAFAITYFIVERSGVAAGVLHTPSGASTPSRSELSRETSLIVAERFEEAIEALTEASARDPADARPPLMIAELYRDRMKQPEEAVPWLRRAAAMPGLALETERMILRDLVELCRNTLERPELATPALARAASAHDGDRLGHWARQELKEIKEGMRD
jgi:tetratricopeptide (TPR) repeat protein